MKLLDRGTIFDATAAPADTRFCTCPSLVRLDNGRLVVALRAGSSKDAADEDTPVLVSDDDAVTWRLAFEGFGDLPPGRGRIRAMALTPFGGDRLVACMTWVDRSDPALPSSIPRPRASCRRARCWRHRRTRARAGRVLGEVPLAPHTGNAITGAIMILQDGRMALPYEAWKEYEDTRPARHHAALRLTGPGGLGASDEPIDLARPVAELAIVAHDPKGEILYWDQRLTVAPDTGEMIAMLWTHDRRSGQDIDIHIAWGSPDRAAMDPTDRAPASRGRSARRWRWAVAGVFAAYVHRHHPPSLRAILSDDFGRTWTAAEELVFYEKADRPASRAWTPHATLPTIGPT